MKAHAIEKQLATNELGFWKPLRKEEKTEKKKQRLATIGTDLIYVLRDGNRLITLLEFGKANKTLFKPQ